MQRRVQASRTRTRTTQSGTVTAAIVLMAALSIPGRVSAQAPPPTQPAVLAPPPPPGEVWAGTFGAGLAVTNGNSDTSNFNVTAKAAYDPANPHLATLDALYLRGSNDGETIVSRTSLNIRDDYSLTERAGVFGQFRYLRDVFKGIDYLAAPTVGVAYKVINRERTRFNVDAGVGVAWERDTDLGTVTTDGAVTIGEVFTHQLTGTSTITHFATGLWKAGDFADALYTVNVGLAAAITSRTQLKLELLELYKTQPPPGRLSQDVSFITSVVYSF